MTNLTQAYDEVFSHPARYSRSFVRAVMFVLRVSRQTVINWREFGVPSSRVAQAKLRMNEIAELAASGALNLELRKRAHAKQFSDSYNLIPFWQIEAFILRKKFGLTFAEISAIVLLDEAAVHYAVRWIAMKYHTSKRLKERIIRLHGLF